MSFPRAAVQTALVLCVWSALIRSSSATEDAVVVLDASNFDKYVQATPLVLVEFYAPWCGHCKQLAPEYAAAADILKAENIPLAKVDAAADKNQKLAEQYEVQGFPTLKLFKNNVATDYMGQRTTHAIVAFMRKKAGPPVTELENDTAASAFKDASDIAVIGFFVDKNSEAYKAFETVASDTDGVPFGVVHDNGIRALFRTEKNQTHPNQIVVYKKFDEKRVVYEGEMQPDPLQKFVAAHGMPLVVPFNEANAAKIFSGPIKVHLIVFADTEKDKVVMEKLVQPAKKFKGEVVVVHVSAAEEQITEYFGVSSADMPAVRLVDMRDVGMKKYVYDKPVVDEESLETFVDDFLAGNLQATLKTEDEPTESEGPVKVVVSKTFKREVMEGENDVLVKFYAPWCGHCKELAPRYEALAAKLQHATKLVIAKVNSEENEMQDVVVEGFPTIRLYAQGKKNEPIEYTGERSTEAIEQWLQGEVTNKWEAEVPAAGEGAAAAEGEAAAPKHEGSEL